VYYPRSFLKLIVAGFLLVSLPLIFAIVNNAFSIHEIVARSQATVRQAVQATQASRLIIEQVTAMERSLRQAAALGDAALLEGYDHARSRFVETVRGMSALRLEPQQAAQLGALERQEAALASRVDVARSQPSRLGALLDDFGGLADIAQALDSSGALVVEQETARLQAMAEAVQRFVFWQLIALVPIALVLLVGAIILISRPITQIDAAIRRLGEGDFQAAIHVDGPKDLERLGQQLEWMRLRLIELEHQKTLFLRHVSHELKTPLASLKEGTDLLQEQVVGQLSPAQREIAGILKQNTERLQQLIEDLLSYHSAQFRKAAPSFRAVSLRDVILRAGEHHRLPMTSKRIRYEVDCPALTLEADREKLAAIVDNLVSNAVKFSPPGGTVRVSAREDAAGIVLEVSDDGPGIAAEDRERVFEPFYQGRTAYTGAVEGTGLGLAIVKDFVAAHQGRVEIVADGRPGTRVRVSLPVRQAERIAA
jgi:two-component system sensor histidine kinase GlrK